MNIRTHVGISHSLVGTPIKVVNGVESTVELKALNEMAADSSGLIHGGFTFGLADYAAMLAVNHPNVVLGSAQARFMAPVKIGETMKAYAKVIKTDGRRSEVNVEVNVDEQKVFTGVFTCYSLEKHILFK
ncbi:MAG: MaoC/PaaZ C-terminal domain-containing protein [Candidatus Bathyarchaeota archaeon]|jgi:acyl-coenzyme A thioesterase PaaI-like protein|nr:MaoC/PaaZ C-terminal domain-containing protein [Candidatus Bathyarchaeota archaeon]